MKTREETANAIVANILERLLGMEVKPETSGRADRRLLDIYVPKNNIVLEAKYHDFDAAAEAAKNRWQNMKPAPQIVGALSYSPVFAQDIEKAIREDAPVEFALSENRYENLRDRKRTGTVFDLAQALRRPAAILRPHEDEIETAVNRIRGALAVFYGYISDDRGTLGKMARILQANFDAGRKEEIYEQTARVGGLILFGAMLFQIALAQKDDRVSPPGNIKNLRREWRFILEKINYAAIFGVAEKILQECALRKAPLQTILDAAEDARDFAEDGVDLMGRIYHTLLADAKPLGAFYTSIPAATLMAGLTLAPEDWGTDEEWVDMDFIKNFRIADPACGSGTLLAAACWQMRDNFSRADAKIHGIVIGGKKAEKKPMDKIQKALLEESIWGYDILETAAHLTATTLGLIAPNVDFRKAHIYRTIIGETTGDVAAGSLEWLEGTPIFKRNRQVEESEAQPEAPEEINACIMNPPFVRGTIGHESFSFLPPKEQKLVHDRIRLLGKRHQFVSDKGQGAAFIALACQHERREFRIKDGGRIAAILPATFASGMGKAWSGARKKIEKYFDLETLIVSREKRRPNFSENTNLQECIVIARKRKNGDKPNKKAMFVVLSQNPNTVESAHATVRAIKLAKTGGAETGNLRINGAGGSSGTAESVAGQYAVLPWHGKTAWRGTSFTNLALAFTAENFPAAGTLKPFTKTGKAALKSLAELADFGSHRMHLYLNDRTVENRRCRLSRTHTDYPIYYPGLYKRGTGIWQKDQRQILEDPQYYVLPLPGHEEWAEKFWSKAGRIAICESFGFNAMRRLALLATKPVQASHYLPVRLRKESGQKLKALALWLNCTPALLLIANAAQSTYGAKVNFSQKAAMELPVLDLEKLSAANLRTLAKLFDETAKGEGFLPIPQMENDPVRTAIDGAFSEIYGFGDLAPLRAALAAEPIITNQPADVSED